MAKTLTPKQPPIVRYSLVFGQPTSVKRVFGRSIRSATQAHQIRLTIEHGEFCFHLFPGTLPAIAQAQRRGDSLQIPKDLQSRLLMHALLEESVVQTQRNKQRRVVHLQSGLTFQTCWYEENQAQGTRVMRTVISLDGDILNQITQNCLNHPRGLEMMSAHYWLMDQLLLRNRFNLAQIMNLMAWAVPTACIGWTLLTNAAGLVSQIGTYAAVTRILMSLGSLAVPVLWDLTQDWLLPPLQLQVKRWIWRELTGSNRWLRGLAEWVLRRS